MTCIGAMRRSFVALRALTVSGLPERCRPAIRPGWTGGFGSGPQAPRAPTLFRYEVRDFLAGLPGSLGRPRGRDRAEGFPGEGSRERQGVSSPSTCAGPWIARLTPAQRPAFTQPASYPSRAQTFHSAFAAGSATETRSRALAPPVTEQPAPPVVDNRRGASGLITLNSCGGCQGHGADQDERLKPRIQEARL